MILYTLFILFFIFVVICSIVKPPYAVYALIFFLSSYGIKSIPAISKYHLSLLLSIVVFIGVFIHPRQRETQFFDGQIALVLSLLLLIVGSIAIAYNPALAISEAYEYAKPILLFFILVRTMEHERDLQGLLLVLVFIGSIHASFAIREVVMGISLRGEGLIDDPNVLGMMLVSLLPLSLYYFTLRKLAVARILGVACAFLISFGIIYTYSRGAFVGMVVVWGLFLLTNIRRKFVIVLISLLFISIAFHYVPERYAEWMQTISTNPQEASASNRLAINLAGLQVFSDHWLTGVGVGNFKQVIPSYLPPERANYSAAHNLYLEFACEMGIFGIFVLLAFLLRTFMINRRVEKQIRRWYEYPLLNLPQFIQLSLIGVLVAAIFLSEFENPFLWVILAFPPIMERMVAAKSREEREGALKAKPSTQRLRSMLAPQKTTLPVIHNLTP